MAKRKLGATDPHLELQLKMPTDMCREEVQRNGVGGGCPWESRLLACLHFLALPWAAIASMTSHMGSSFPRNSMGFLSSS